MVQALSEKIVKYAIQNDHIKQEQQEEYLYALNLILNIIFTDITMLFIGFLMHMVWESIAFWLVYKILRKYCGGFHFGTSLTCYLSSCVMCPVVLLIIRYAPLNIAVWSVITAAAAVFLLIFSPVSAANKPLDEKETVVFGKVARILVLLAAAAYTAMAVLSISTAVKIISLSIVSVMLFVAAGVIQHLFLKNNI